MDASGTAVSVSRLAGAACCPGSTCHLLPLPAASAARWTPGLARGARPGRRPETPCPARTAPLGLARGTCGQRRLCSHLCHRPAGVSVPLEWRLGRHRVDSRACVLRENPWWTHPQDSGAHLPHIAIRPALLLRPPPARLECFCACWPWGPVGCLARCPVAVVCLLCLASPRPFPLAAGLRQAGEDRSRPRPSRRSLGPHVGSCLPVRWPGSVPCSSPRG